ncbi:centromere protein U isoform X2 [Sebastes umbrosus]|uniref:centromere protein U isoform X2 n=1 Tax=Sebastes umbrosus TaxID=72105 RepID=UPI00189CFAF7|nr:centromere protein U isoform X2 [Sebastes umbrosus]
MCSADGVFIKPTCYFTKLQWLQMSAKKGRGARELTVPQLEMRQKGSSNDNADSPNLSAIERASFLEGLQQNYGNPLHSTAMEEDLGILEEEGMNGGKAGRKEIPQTTKTTVKQRGAAAKSKQTESDGENEEEEEKKKDKQMNRGKAERKEIPQTTKTIVKQRGAAANSKQTESDGENEEEEEKKKDKQMNGGKAERKAIPQTTKTTVKQGGAAAKRKVTERDGQNEEEEENKKRSRRSAGGTSAAGLVKNQQMKKGKKSKSGSGSGMSSDPEPHGKSDCGTAQQKRKKVLSSEEEGDEDQSWCPSPKKAKLYSLGGTRKSSSDKFESRKSSSGSASAEPEKADTDKQRRKRRGGVGGTQLEVVLDAFLEFCDQYRESVESNVVKQSIDSFSSNVEEQLMEKISSSKELKVLKRENGKVGSLIHKKTQRLLDAKHELMRAERQVWTLQKEKAELKVRLADLRRGQAFLHDIRELNRQYLDYRHKHPKEKETYGAPSLPALLLETKHMQAAEHQRGINNPLKRRLKKNKTRK